MKQWRIVGLGDYHNYPSYFTLGILEGAIRCGAWFRPVPLFGQNLGAIAEQVDFFKPHIIMSHMIFNRSPHHRDDVLEMMRGFKKRGIVTIYHAGDARPEPRYPQNISEYISFALCNFGGEHKDNFSKIWNVPCYHWPYACLFQNGIVDKDPRYECDVAFTGALSGDPVSPHYKRTQFLEQLKGIGMNVKVFPNAEVGNTRFQTAEMSASANAILGVQMGENFSMYLDVRPFQYIGAGAVYFHNRSKVMRKFFAPDIHYMEYDSLNPGSFMEAYREAKPKAEQIRKEGFQFGQRWHSTQARMQFVLDLLEGKTDKPKLYLDEVEQ